jgi:Concanavalin A-like lectin/glucanases superfamily
MAIFSTDRVKVNSTTTGTGAFTLGSAVSGYQDFSGVGDQNQTYYTIVNGTEWETGIGTHTKVPGFSYYFNGTNNLSLANIAGLALGTGNFTVEFWIYNKASTLPSFTGLFDQRNGTNGVSVIQPTIEINTTVGYSWYVAAASRINSGVGNVALGQWQHVAVTRSGTSSKMFVDGTQVGSTFTDTYNYPAGSITLAKANDGVSARYLTGYISNFRIVIGTALYTDNFTPPTEPLTAVSGTELLTCQSRTIVDNSTNGHTITNVNGVGIDEYIPFARSTISSKTLSRDYVLSSSNSNELVNFSAGTKEVFIPQPAFNTQGTTPTADDGSISTDLVAWENFRKNIFRSINSGVTFNNKSTNGIVSTYALVYTTSNAFAGGVLAPNGDVHFIPSSAARGQKVNNGVVSTYSLVYTTSIAYWGGVLAPNGDIHFVPHNANRGQKVSASGLVSTYSLVFTVGSAYIGGVLDPSGSIHFIPYSANSRGQKISSDGTVSTYSLVYTVSAAYYGGVLAPNGDIHFVPYAAAVGQKVSSAGVVSTYSLVYTTSTGYNGGVLTPNGDIHFVPYTASVGQKVSLTGTVSTYSLVYTTTGAYSGGVLAPNGDIHFIPRGASVGQKVSLNGTVSTYSLVYTVSNGFNGGVLTPTGDILFVSYSGVRAQQISICPGIPLKLESCLSPFLNKL